MKRKMILIFVLAGCLLSSCNKTEAPAQGPRATVTKRDGTLVAGTVLSTTSSEIKIEGDDHVTVTIPMSQVRSVDYQDSSSNAATAPAGGSTSNAPDNGGQTASGGNMSHEAHEHPAESAITTKTYDLPAGTTISVRTEETIDSARAVEGQTFAAEVTQPVRDQSGATVIPRGANAKIIITSASRGDRFTKASDLSLDLRSVAIEGRQYRISTVDVRQRGKQGLGANKRTAEYSGGGAVLGAVIGAIAGGGKGAAIGAGAGAGAGAVTQVVTKGGAIKVPVETVLTFRLDRPLHVEAAR